MDTSALKNFAQESRRYLMDVVSKKIEYYLTTDNVEVRAKKHLVEELKKEITNSSKDQVIEKIAYTWFNRFCALRYMDVKQYSLVGVLTPVSESHTQPEILMEAKSGHIKDELGNSTSRDHVIGLLSGKVSSNDPQSEAYKLLVLMACNYYHSIMPFLFEKIDDYTELLMPDDLLSEASIISKVRDALSEDNCKDVEVIGWLYQFYISEKKDEVFDGLKKNKKITPENIPAATQLFTPNWIVRYLVENSLGRLWMLNRPNSNLISKMEYYIKPETEEKDFLKIKGPEEIKVCDPACGSGHMLVYAFDILYSMYEEEGVDTNEIPTLILKNNLFGIEIDKRAGELAALALTMKAREKQRRYFRNPANPNICVLENIHFEESEIKDYMDHVGNDLFSSQLRNTLTQFEEAKNFGSLIRPEVSDVDNTVRMLDQKNVSGHLFLTQTHYKVLKILLQSRFLTEKYQILITNPPYMGNKGMNDKLKVYLNKNFSDSKTDLMTCFMQRATEMLSENSFWGMINLPSWMFLNSFEKFRENLVSKQTISSLVHLGRGIFGSDFGSVAFVILNRECDNKTFGLYRRLFKEHVQVRSVNTIKELYLDKDYGKYIFYQESYKNIPGYPIAYWVTKQMLDVFEHSKLGTVLDPKAGVTTGNNDKYLRYWWEVNPNNFLKNSKASQVNGTKTFTPHMKGGDFRRWYGNFEYVLEYWSESIQEMKKEKGFRPDGFQYFFREMIAWSKLTAGKFSARFVSGGASFDTTGTCGFSKEHLIEALGLLNSSFAQYVFSILNPTLTYLPRDVKNIPLIGEVDKSIINECIMISKDDWDEQEVSWDFTQSVFLKYDLISHPIQGSLEILLQIFSRRATRLSQLEEANNRNIISEEAAKELGIEHVVPVRDIALFSNLLYKSSNDDLDSINSFKREAIKDLISYVVGVLFGRFIPEKLFKDQDVLIDKDNVIPILSSDWFEDDLTNKFKNAIRVIFGKGNFNENILYIENLIKKDLRTYFINDFYADHLKRYKKRPIYWMFSSPKGTFNALIYMHRYTPDTVNIVLNSYLREFGTKLNSKRENLERLSVAEDTSAREKTAALKEIEQLKKMIVELDEYEKDILYPLATQRLEIDLDDGVKANYPKFGKALKTIKGLDKDED